VDVLPSIENFHLPETDIELMQTAMEEDDDFDGTGISAASAIVAKCRVTLR
jgi:hypothetical protein